MKRVCLLVLLAVLLLCALPAQADEAGVLTETELGKWLNGLLLSTAGVEPMNAPVGEEALTEDGYAFIYDTATFYYNKPTLDAQSVLNAIAVTDENLSMPRGVNLGVPQDALMEAYGWMNMDLVGDGSFATLYVLNHLPQGAYWALAQRNGSELQSVQCAIHAYAGEDRYTDAGILYTVMEGAVTGIRVYGLNTYVTRAEVENNLQAVGGVIEVDTAQTQGVTLVSAAQAFGQSDMEFGGIAFFTLTDADAAAVFGQPVSESWAQDDTGAWLHMITYNSTSLVFTTDANKQNAQLETLAVTDASMSGPRGLVTGMGLSDVMALYRSDGTGETLDAAALLYGDGQNAPYGTLEQSGNDATLRYTAVITDAKGAERQIVLHISFTDGVLSEWMLYTF